MARDDHPRHRRARRIERKAARREAFERILIVTEGEKTEVNYFEEIRREYRLPSAAVHVCPADGTNPLQVVNYALDFCQKTCQWERVFAVIDRDDHAQYDEALRRAAEHNGTITNDEKQPIAFQAIPSNPCFELWPLLHFQRSEAHIHRDDVVRLLSGYINGYQKGKRGLFAATHRGLEAAYMNAQLLRQRLERPAQNPSTDVDILVRVLTTLRNDALG
ncbi:RloB domain-containing protein [Burkholderia sp. Bp8963]|uniref:RloB family protein n=1 Tax=Burkholderia sp. Bp8963 TaxID=2184547 RepID=UPI000F595686|nr:RloB family protein [Burkholderia sp. Bp8963]RQS57435.1 RloB domain-containing protein [Burkholderia sp. Bp8963]